jgi:hypothetical protein
MTAARLADRLPAIGVVRRWSQSLAVLDAIMSAEREYRYFSFDAQFGPGHALASMRDGSGDEYSITFADDGAFVRGFDHGSPVSPFIRTPPALWPGLLIGLPASLAAAATEPAFTMGGVPMMTVALWRLAGDEQWHYGQITYPHGWENEYADPDGSSWLFAQLDGRAESYIQYASEYFEHQLPAGAVTAIIEHRPLTAALVRALNPGRSYHNLTGELSGSDIPRNDLPGRHPPYGGPIRSCRDSTAARA